VIVVSQEFHNARAIYIAQHIGLQAYGYNAKNVNSQSQMKIIFREFFSRIKCLMDLYLLNTQPKHLGEKIKI
jgi:SanA protein